MKIRTHTFSATCFTMLFALVALTGCESSADLTAEQHIEKAQGFIDKNDLSSAVIELKNALQKDANQPEARWRLGNVYLDLGNGGAAEKEFNKAQSLGFTHPDFTTANLKAHLYQAEFQSVVDRINSMDPAESGTADIQVIKGDALLGMGDRNAALQSYLNAQELESDNVNALIGLTRLAFINGQQEKADSYIEEALAIAPENVDVWNLKGRSALFKTDPVAAEKAFTKAANLAPYNLTAQFGLVRALLAQQKIEAAMEPIKKVDERYPKHPVTQYFRAYIALQENDSEKAKEHLQSALQLQPNHPESLFMMSRLLLAEGKLDQANEHLTPYMQENPGNVAAIKLKAAILTGLNQPGEAVELLETAAGKNPDDARLIALLGTTHVRNGNPERGIELLEQAIAMTDGNVAELKTQLAVARMSAGSTDLAISDLESAIAEDSEFVNADILLVLSHLRAGKYEEAATAAGNFAQKAPDNPMPLNLMGAAYAGMNDTAKAREKFEQALELNPEYVPALVNIAGLDLQQDNRDAAEKTYQKVLKIAPDNNKALIQMARLEANRNNLDKMHDYLQQARDANENALEPRVLLGRYYLQSGQPAMLYEVTSEAYELSPGVPDVMLLHGQALRFNGDIDQSREILEQLVEKVPESANAVFQLGMTEAQAGNFDAAQAAIDKALELEPEHAGALNAAAKLALQENDTSLASEYSTRLQSVQPDLADTHALQGDIFRQENNHEAAIRAYEKAMDLAGSTVVLAKLAGAYELSGQDDQAIMVMSNWLQENPHDVTINLMLARTFQEGNKVSEAMDIYEKIISGPDPDNIVALNNLAWLSIETDLNYAHELASKANELSPDQPQILDTLGWILVKQDKIERAITHLRAAQSINPESPQVRYHLAYALAEAGEKQRAKKELESLLSENINFSEKKEAEELYNSL